MGPEYRQDHKGFYRPNERTRPVEVYDGQLVYDHPFIDAVRAANRARVSENAGRNWPRMDICETQRLLRERRRRQEGRVRYQRKANG